MLKLISASVSAYAIFRRIALMRLVVIALFLTLRTDKPASTDFSISGVLGVRSSRMPARLFCRLDFTAFAFSALAVEGAFVIVDFFVGRPVFRRVKLMLGKHALFVAAKFTVTRGNHPVIIQVILADGKIICRRALLVFLWNLLALVLRAVLMRIVAALTATVNAVRTCIVFLCFQPMTVIPRDMLFARHLNAGSALGKTASIACAAHAFTGRRAGGEVVCPLTCGAGEIAPIAA